MSTRIAQVGSGGLFDFVNDNGLESDEGLETDCILSLFQDARATDDELAEAGLTSAENRGCWGDSFPETDGDQEGSKLWLLARSMRTAETLERAKSYAEEALAWLVQDEVANEIIVETSWWPGTGVLALRVAIVKRDGQRWERVWAAVSGELLEAA